jgi:hypothetical protein
VTCTRTMSSVDERYSGVWRAATVTAVMAATDRTQRRTVGPIVVTYQLPRSRFDAPADLTTRAAVLATRSAPTGGIDPIVRRGIPSGVYDVPRSNYRTVGVETHYTRTGYG